MVLETEPLTFLAWLPGALQAWALTMVLLGGALLFAGGLRVAILYGFTRGGDRLAAGVFSGLRDLLRISPRRVLALAWLAVQESLRRSVLAGLAVFALILMFALWFLDSENLNPAGLYVNFVVTCTSFLVMVMALLMSVFSLPNDLKSHTIYTIVTKPVRATEIVLGRILGFSAVGTVLLMLMGGASYAFVVRSLGHTHEFQPAESSASDTNSSGLPVEQRIAGTRLGSTSDSNGHHHSLIAGANGSLATDMSQGHWHPITADERSGKTHYVVGPPQGQFHARVPIYGKLHFKDRTGADAARGISVGNEWAYRSYIEGGTLAAAVWRFDAVRSEQFPNGLLLDMTIRVFRTHKGEIEKGILGSLVFRNPVTKRASSPHDFVAKEYSTDRQLIPRQLTDDTGQPLDLFKDLVADGQLDVELSCLARGQFFGMAQPDLYLLARDASVPFNFVKGFFGTWLQMVLVTSFGVMWSTFLNGPVALLATLGTIVVGFADRFVQDLAENKVAGGGSFEALVRIVQHKNVQAPLDDTWGTAWIHFLDWCVRGVLTVIANLLPNFGAFSSVQYLVDGFNVPADRLLVQAATAIAYFLPAFFLGYLCFKLREVAK